MTMPTRTVNERPIAREGEEPQSGEVLLRVKDLYTHFDIRGGWLGVTKVGAVRAVDGVSFEVRAGETLGLVGESGCGKTTLGKTILGLIKPTAGTVSLREHVLFDLPKPWEPKNGRKQRYLASSGMKKIRQDMQVVFQDPYASLNPRMTVGEIIGEGPMVHGLKDKKKREDLVRELLTKVGLNQSHILRYPHEFSGGQRQRIGIARALALNPDFVVLDEPVSALDVSIQSQVLNLLDDLQKDLGLTYLFIAHNLAVVEHISDRVGVMYLGKIVELGGVDELYADPRHPYTVALLSAVPEPDPKRRRRRLVLQGDVPSPINPPSGCRFHTRCWLREQLGNPENCVTDEPPLRPVGGAAQLSACHWAEKITPQGIQAAAESARPLAAPTPTANQAA